MSDRVHKVTLDYIPRAAFLPFHNRSKRKTVIVAHRRAGKTYSVIQDLVARALNFQKKNPKTGQYFPKPVFAYVCPYRGQAKKVAWEYLVAFTENIPGIKKNETELWIEIPTVTSARARIFLAGADNPDNLRGQYFDGVVLDEYGDMKPEVYSTVLRPALADRKGWVVFMGTPKGKNDFYKRWQMALAKPNEYFSICLKASESGILDEAEIEDMKSEMETEEWEQELECSFDAAFRGSFYGKQIAVAQSQDKFRPFITRDCPYGYVVGEPVSLAIDAEKVLRSLPAWDGRIVIDGTNPVAFFDPATSPDAQDASNPLAAYGIKAVDLGGKHSSQIIAQYVPSARVVKAFNHNDVNVLKEPEVAGGKRVLFYSGDDAAAKAEVRAIMEAAGFLAVDLGSLDMGGPLTSLPFGPLSTHNFIRI